MKLLLLTEFFPPDKSLRFTGGVEARTFFIARELSQKNKVLVICRKTKGLSSFKKMGNVYIYPCGFKTLNIEANFFSVFERLIFLLAAFFKGLSLDFDLVEGSNFVSYLPAYFLGLVKKKPKVAWYADFLGRNWFKYFGLTGLFGWLIESLSLKFRWNGVIALSQSTKNKLVKAGIDEKKITVVYGGVDLREPRTQNQEPRTKKKAIICVARLVKYKRIEDLILVFKRLSKKYPRLTLAIVGQGPEEKNLKKLVKDQNLVKQVKFFKNLSRERLIKLLKQSYLFCLPSVIEGFGLATIEAAACGLPYVVSDIAVNREITQNGQGGLLFKPCFIDDLSHQIGLLLRDKKLYRQKRKQVINLAAKYEWEKIVKETQKAYDKSIISFS